MYLYFLIPCTACRTAVAVVVHLQGEPETEPVPSGTQYLCRCPKCGDLRSGVVPAAREILPLQPPHAVVAILIAP